MSTLREIKEKVVREITSCAPPHFLVFQEAYEHQGIPHRFFCARPSSMVLLDKQWPISEDKKAVTFILQNTSALNENISGITEINAVSESD